MRLGVIVFTIIVITSAIVFFLVGFINPKLASIGFISFYYGMYKKIKSKLDLELKGQLDEKS